MKVGVSLLLLLCAVALAQDKPVDPGGWTKAKWGMTEAQIKEAFPEAKNIIVFGSPMLGIEHYQIAALKYRVTFYFDKKESKAGLMRVALQSEDPVNLMGTYASVAKDALLDALRDRYGEPTSTGNERTSTGLTHEWKWLLPQTSIDLSYAESNEMKYRFTILQYNKRTQSDQL